MKDFDIHILKECTFKTSRSGGAGGQHVNKVETKVILFFDIKNSKILNADQKAMILENLKNKISKNEIIQIAAQKHKSQIKNKKLAQEKIIYLLQNALKEKKKRKKTKIPKGVHEKRLKVKQINSDKKVNRKKIQF